MNVGGFSRRDRRMALGAGWFVVLAGLITAVAMIVFGDETQRGAEASAGAAALGLLIATPGVLALLGVRRNRPALLVPAAVALLPLSMLSFAGVLLPLAVVGTVLGVAAVRSVGAEPAHRVVVPIVTGLAGIIGAAGTRLGRTTTHTVTTADGSWSTTGWVPWSTSLLVVGILVTSTIAAVAAAGPTRRTRPSPAPYPTPRS